MYYELFWGNWRHFDGLWFSRNATKACTSVIFTCTAYYIHRVSESEDEVRFENDKFTGTSREIINTDPLPGESTSGRDWSVTLIGHNYISRDPNLRHTRSVLPKVIIYHLCRYRGTSNTIVYPPPPTCLYCKYKQCQYITLKRRTCEETNTV